jgi:hypothetical protein
MTGWHKPVLSAASSKAGGRKREFTFIMQLAFSTAMVLEGIMLSHAIY